MRKNTRVKIREGHCYPRSIFEAVEAVRAGMLIKKAAETYQMPRSSLVLRILAKHMGLGSAKHSAALSLDKEALSINLGMVAE